MEGRSRFSENAFGQTLYFNAEKRARGAREARRRMFSAMLDVKGERHFDHPYKYYCEDVGLRNARTGFRRQEPTHLMENIVYNELVLRGYSVDVGHVESTETRDGRRQRVPREIGFVVNKPGQRVYIKSAYSLDTDEKRLKELKPFSMTGDSFRKVIVRNDVGKRWYDDTGVLNINVIGFLLEPIAIE